MSRREDTLPPQRQLGALLLLCAGAVAAAAVLRAAGAEEFQPYFGRVDAVWATLLVMLLGSSGLLALYAYHGLDLHRRGAGRGVRAAALFAALLVVPVIVVDLFGGFPPDINVAAPRSLLFYPLMALVAEMTFHVIPLAALLTIAGKFLQNVDRQRRLGRCILLVALLEPVFQVATASSASPTWANAYVGVHVWIINLLGLGFFVRHGFFTMLAFRAIYYLFWHIVWGVLRLGVRF